MRAHGFQRKGIAPFWCPCAGNCEIIVSGVGAMAPGGCPWPNPCLGLVQPCLWRQQTMLSLVKSLRPTPEPCQWPCADNFSIFYRTPFLLLSSFHLLGQAPLAFQRPPLGAMVVDFPSPWCIVLIFACCCSRCCLHFIFMIFFSCIWALGVFK